VKSIANDGPQNKADESEMVSQEDAFDEFSVLVTVPTINVRSNPDFKNDNNKVVNRKGKQKVTKYGTVFSMLDNRNII